MILYSSTSVFLCHYFSNAAPYSFIFLPTQLNNFFSQFFCFLCQYHSTTAPYTLIQLPFKLYDGFLSLLRFSLLSIFHHRTIHIHSFTTHTALCFSPITPLFPFCIIDIMLHTHSLIYEPTCIIIFSQ